MATINTNLASPQGVDDGSLIASMFGGRTCGHGSMKMNITAGTATCNSLVVLRKPTVSIDPNDPNGAWSDRALNGRGPCFATGTQIATPFGTCRVEDLHSGDLIETLDGGVQPVLWAGGGPVLSGDASPLVHIAAGVLGATRDLRVSGHQPVLLRDRAAELLFGEDEILIVAQDLIGSPGVTQSSAPQIIGQYHILLPYHCLVVADGVAAESLTPGPQMLDALSPRVLADLRAKVAMPDLIRLGEQPFARRLLKPHEARILLAMLHEGDAASRIEVLLGLVA